jgi:hypothetical protein
MPSNEPDLAAMSNDIEQLRQGIQTLRQENIKLKRREANRKRTNVELSKNNLKLDTEILDLRTEILKLKNDVLRIKGENLQLTEADLKRSQELAGAEERSLKMEQESKYLSHKATTQAHLIKVGVAVRLKFWEEAKEVRCLGPADKLIVEAGNRAVRERDLLADAALFDLGYIAELWPKRSPLDIEHQDSETLESEGSTPGSSTTGESDSQPSGKTSRQQLSRSFYRNLYSLSPHEVKAAPLSPEAIEFFNMTATMSSCSPSFITKAS